MYPNSQKGKDASPRATKRRVGLVRGQISAVFLVLVGLLLGGSLIRNMWVEAQRREMYLDDLKRVVTKNNTDGKLFCVAAARYAQTADYAESAALLKRAVEMGETDVLVWRSWAASEMAQGKRKEAVAVLSTGRSLFPNIAQQLKLSIDAVAALLPEADVVTAATTISPGGANELIAVYAPVNWATPMVQAMGRRNPWTSGFATRESWTKEVSNSPLVLSLWSDALRRNNRLREAEVQALAAIQLDRRSPDAHLAYARVLYDGGLVAKAGVEFKTVLSLRPKWVPALIGLGNVGVDKQLIGLAVNAFEEAKNLAPSNPDAWIGLGRAYGNQQLRHDKAMEAFATAAHLAPDRTDFYPYYSDALRFNFRFAEAEALMRKRIADAPTDARSHFLLAALLLDNAQTPQREEEGEELLRKSLLLDDRAYIVRLRLAQLLLRKNKPAEVIQILERANKDFPLNSQIVTLLGRAYQRTGNKVKFAESTRIARDLVAYQRDIESAEARERSNLFSIAVHMELAALYRQGRQEEKARRQEEVIYYLQKYPDAARRGLTALQEGTASVMPASKDILKQRR